MASTHEGTAGENKARGLSEQADRVMEDVRDLGQAAASSATEVAKDLRDQGLEALKAGKKKAVQAKDGLESGISDNPWKSVLIAAGIGALIGYAIRSSR